MSHRLAVHAAAFVLFAGLTSGWADEPTRTPVVERFAGDYQLVEMEFVTESGGEGPDWMRLTLREGRGVAAWLPLFAPTIDASDVRLVDGRLTGRVQDVSPAHTAGIRFVYVLDARVEGNRISGTWKRSASKSKVRVRDVWSTFLEPAEGSLTGTIRSATEVTEEQSFAEGADWPQWLGPHGNRTAAESNAELVESLFDARPVWKSEATIAASPGRANDIPRHGVRSLYNRPSGGGSTPIVADGKVFLNFYEPTGDAYDRNAARIYTEQLKSPEIAPYFEGALPTLHPLRVVANDVVIAVDAHTGALLWRTTFPEGGANHTSHKNDLTNLTMVHAEGRVYAIGSTMRLRCLNASTGELVWEQPLGPITETLEGQRDEGVRVGRWISKRNRDWGSAPIVLAGLVISADMTSGLVAFDARTGEVKWRAAKVAWKNSTPHAWTAGGENRVIVSDLKAIHCLDAASGTTLWTTPAICYRSITVTGNLMAYQDLVGPPDASDRDYERRKDSTNHTLVVTELTAERPRTLWHTVWKPTRDGEPVKDQYSGYCRPQIVGDRLFLSGRVWTDCFDVRTGDRLARLEAAGGVANAGHLLSAHGRLFSVVDGKHGTTRMAMYTTDPDDFRPTGPDETWTPPHPNTTSYGPSMLHPVVDGRLFIRGYDALYCYDLRARTD